MGYYIRLFTTSPLSTLVPLQAQMLQKGYRVQPAGTNQLDIFYAAGFSHLTVDLTDSSNLATHEVIAKFLEVVSQLSQEPEQVRVLDILARTEAVVTIGIPDDYDDQSETLNEVIDIVVNSADGFLQVDGEGFYENSQLILPLD